MQFTKLIPATGFPPEEELLEVVVVLLLHLSFSISHPVRLPAAQVLCAHLQQSLPGTGLPPLLAQLQHSVNPLYPKQLAVVGGIMVGVKVVLNCCCTC